MGAIVLALEDGVLVLEADFVDLEATEVMELSSKAELEDARVGVKMLEAASETVLREVTSTV